MSPGDNSISCCHRPKRFLPGVRPEMGLEGAGPRIRFPAYSAEVGSAIVVGCDWVASGSYAQRMLAGQLQPRMAVHRGMGMGVAAHADQAIGRGLIHPRLLLHGIILLGGT